MYRKEKKSFGLSTFDKSFWEVTHYMELKVGWLNKGEMFCCSVKKAKDLFKDTEIHLNFACYGRVYSTFAETKEGYYLKNNIKSRVISSMYMLPGAAQTILAFYVVKRKSFPEDLKTEFEQVYLPKYYEIYNEMLNANKFEKTRMVLVEHIDGKLKLHDVRFYQK